MTNATLLRVRSRLPAESFKGLCAVVNCFINVSGAAADLGARCERESRIRKQLRPVRGVGSSSGRVTIRIGGRATVKFQGAMQASRVFVAIAVVGIAIAVLELIGPTVNAATAAQILLLVVLADARFLGVQAALFASILAAAGLFRYFVTPIGFAVGDPNDIAALAAFVIMAVVGGELAFRAERRAQEVERLYEQLQAAFERESDAEALRR